MRFTDEFDKFLEDTVNLSEGRLRKLEDRVSTIENVLRTSTVESDLVVVDARPQGSFAQETIINPRDEGRGYDADLLVEFEDRGLNPQGLLKATKMVLKSSQRHASLIKAKNRCITVEYAGEFHLDVVPSVRDQFGLLYIANKETNGWEPTDPDGFNVWMDDHNDKSNGHLIPVIRLCKYLRDYKNRPKIKSVILSILLAQQVEKIASEEFEDLPTTLVLLLEALASWSALFGSPPALKEPTCEAVLRLDDTNWTAFSNQIASLARRAREAYDEDDEAKSLALCRKLFGDKFPAPKLDLREAAMELEDGEQDLWRDFGIPTKITETVAIKAEVRQTSGFRGGLISRLKPLQKYRGLSFELTNTSVAYPYDAYWKVKNRGDEARRAGGLRGEITLDHNGPNAQKSESTKWRGDHYVEIYIVKDGVCVARAREEVPIT